MSSISTNKSATVGAMGIGKLLATDLGTANRIQRFAANYLLWNWPPDDERWNMTPHQVRKMRSRRRIARAATQSPR